MGADLPYILIEAGRVGELDYNVYPDRAFWRYYFAGQALAGFCAAAAPDYTKGACAEAITERAARQADLLIAKLEAPAAPPSIGDEGTP